MYTINKVNGIGQIINQDENTYSVYFADTDKTVSLLKKFVTAIYNTLQEAEMAMSPAMTVEETNTLYASIKEQERIDKDNAGASEWLAAKNKENAMKNKPSSLR